MTKTIRRQILEAIKTLLTGATDAGTNVFRSRAEPIAREISPAIVVRWKPDELHERNGFGPFAIETRDLGVVLEVITRGDVPDDLADPILIQAHRLLLTEGALGGLADAVLPGEAEFEEDDTDQTAGIVSAHFTVRYLVRSWDPSLQP